MKLISLVILAVLILQCSALKENKAVEYEKEEIIIDLHKDVDIIDFISEYISYALQEIEILTPGLNIILFSFNKNAIDLNRFIAKLKKDELVQSARANIKL